MLGTTFIDWLPAISSTSLFAVLLWLSRNLIITRLTNSVKHEYNEKIEKLKNQLRMNEEEFKTDLKLKEAQIEALRSGALSNISSRQTSIFNRQLIAIEELWELVISLAPAKTASFYISTFRVENLTKEVINKNPKLKSFIAVAGNIDLEQFTATQFLKSRPFISPVTWAYYSAYRSILVHAAIRLQLLSKGQDMGEVVDIKQIISLITIALPHRKNYVEEHGFNSFHFLIDELESKLLESFDLMIKGEESDQASLEKAAAIIQQSEKLLESN